MTSPEASQAREALDRYTQAVERLKSGDWKGFGTQFDAMRFGGNEPTLHWPLVPPNLQSSAARDPEFPARKLYSEEGRHGIIRGHITRGTQPIDPSDDLRCPQQ